MQMFSKQPRAAVPAPAQSGQEHREQQLPGLRVPARLRHLPWLCPGGYGAALHLRYEQAVMRLGGGRSPVSARSDCCSLHTLVFFGSAVRPGESRKGQRRRECSLALNTIG